LARGQTTRMVAIHLPLYVIPARRGGIGCYS